MSEDKKNDFAPSFWAKMRMKRLVRKKIRVTNQAIANNKLVILLFQSQLLPLVGDEYKEERADIMLKIGQLEAQILADQRGLEFFENVDLRDTRLYSPVKQ